MIDKREKIDNEWLIFYKAPNRTGVDKVILSDTSGSNFIIEIEVTGDFHITPSNPFVTLEEEIIIKAIGGVGKVEWTLEDGEEISISENSITLKAPNQSGKYEIMAIDESGNIAISLLSVVSSTLNISTSSTKIPKNSSINLKVNGGIAPYLWSSTSGYLSNYEGNLNIVVTDSMGTISKLDLEIIESDNSTKILNIKDGWNLLSIPVDKTVPLSEFTNYRDIYTYNNKWELNPSELSSKVGFWINSTQSQEMIFIGESYFMDLNNISTGWQLLGSGNLIEPNYSINQYLIWVFKNSEWVKNPNVINAGEGFWIKR